MAGESLTLRVLLGMEEAVLNAEGIYNVTRTLTLSFAEDGDTGSFTCTASATIPGLGTMTDMVTFSLTVQSKLP